MRGISLNVAFVRGGSRAALATALLLPCTALSWGYFAVEVVSRAPEPSFGKDLVWPASAGWAAARLALQGRADILYSDEFTRESVALGVHGDIFQANMPTTALLYMPLAWLPARTAYALWTWLSFGCFALGWVALLRMCRAPPLPALAGSVLVPGFAALADNIRLGHAYAFLFLPVVLSGLAYLPTGAASRQSGGERPGPTAGREAVAAVALGVLACARVYFAGWLALPLVMQRQWRVLGWALILFGTAGAATVLMWGPGLWVEGAGMEMAWRDRPVTAHPAYQSLNAFMSHLFRYDSFFNPAPPMNAPWLAGPLWWTLALGIVLVCGRAVYRARSREEPASARRLLPFCLVVLAALLLAPVSEEHHFVLVLIPLVVCGAVLVGERGSADGPTQRHRWLLWGMFVASLVLLGGGWKYNTLAVEGWGALLHYPRLYGTGVLLLLVLLLLRREGTRRLQVADHDR